MTKWYDIRVVRHSEAKIASKVLTPPLVALRRDLGDFGYRWLVACAAFGALRLPITLHLGAALKRADGATPPSEEEVVALSALPWFRQGFMPEGLRAALLHSQSAQDRATTATALADLFHSMIEADIVSVHGQVTIQQAQAAPLYFAQSWAAWRSSLPAALAERDKALDGLIGKLAKPSRRGHIVLLLGLIGGAAGWQAGVLLRDRLPAEADFPLKLLTTNQMRPVVPQSHLQPAAPPSARTGEDALLAKKNLIQTKPLQPDREYVTPQSLMDKYILPELSLSLPTIEANSDRPGGDYNRKKLTSLSACRDLCGRESKCMAYTFVPPGYVFPPKSPWLGPVPMCWLKSRQPGRIDSRGMTSGIKTTAPAQPQRGFKSIPMPILNK